MAYRSIEPKIWQDSKFRKLSKDCKLLFFYLITNNHSHYSGIYYIPLQLIEFETGISNEDVLSNIKALISTGIIKYDNSNNIVWVIKMAKYQCKGFSKDLIKGIKKHFDYLESQLIDEFIDFYHADLNEIN